jgi:acetyl esterase/lipase
MLRPRAVALLPALAIAAIAAGPAAARPGGAGGDVRCRASGPVRGGLVLLHPGGFVLGATAHRLRTLCRPWARAGFDVVAVDLPLADVPGDLRRARAATRALRATEGRRPVLAYGESTGGTLAAWLAVRHHVDAAAAVAAPSDLLTWQTDAYWTDLVHLDRAGRRAASPLRRIARPAPLLLLHSPDDTAVPYAQSAALHHRVRGSTLIALRGEHLADATAVPRASRWLRTHPAR